MDLKKNTLSGMVWKFGERIIAQGVSLIVSIILARILTPDDYSVVGIVGIFFAFANVFISSGLNTSLIQKKDSDIKDYSTVLIVSVAISIFMYIIVFLSAPIIANMYSKKLLIPIFRVMGITLIINAVKSIVCAYTSSNLQFKKFFLSTIIGTVISGVVGIILATKGAGPWALVAQQMTNSTIDTIILLISTRIKFVFYISVDRLKSLFKFGWKVFAAQIISVIYDKINPLIIGIKYTTTDLAYYTKGSNFPELINSSVTDTFSAVLFPVMAKIQDEKETLLKYIRRYIGVASFVIFPMMLGFAAVSDNFITVVLTEKWLPASIYLKILSIAYMFNIIQVGNIQAIKAIGRSDITLITEIIKKVSYLIVIVLFLVFSKKPEMLAVACIVNTGIATIVNTYPNRTLIGYTYKLQIMDVIPNLLSSVLMAIVVVLLGTIEMNVFLLLTIQICSGVLVYLLFNIMIHNQNLYYLLSIIKSYTIKKTK